MRYILTSILILGTCCCFSQSDNKTFFKLKSSELRAILNDPKGNFMEASGWQSSGSELLTLDLGKRQLIMYAAKIQKFDLVTTADIYYDDHQDKWMLWKAVDDNGNKCTIRLLGISVSSPGFNSEIFIDYLDHTINFKTYLE